MNYEVPGSYRFLSPPGDGEAFKNNLRFQTEAEYRRLRKIEVAAQAVIEWYHARPYPTFKTPEPLELLVSAVRDERRRLDRRSTTTNQRSGPLTPNRREKDRAIRKDNSQRTFGRRIGDRRVSLERRK